MPISEIKSPAQIAIDNQPYNRGFRDGWELAHEPAECGHARANWKDKKFGTPEYRGQESCEFCDALAALPLLDRLTPDQILAYRGPEASGDHALPKRHCRRSKPMPLSASEASVEAEIKTKGLTAPRLTPADIDAAIAGEDYYVFPNTTVTVCALTLRNGFVTIGHSACASRDMFDAAIGRRLARERARNEIWALEGYLLREKLAALEEIGMMSEAMTPEVATQLDLMSKSLLDAVKL